MYENLIELEKLMEKYGCGDKKLYLTEIAWSDAPGFVSTRQKSAYMLRTVALIGHRLDMFLWYSSQRKDYVADLKERYYGFIYGDGYAGDDVPYGAHPSLFPIAHWNSLMTNSKFIERIDGKGDDVRLYRFTTEDGRDIIFAYTTDEERNRNIGLRLGVESAEVRDMFGNPQTVSAKNGTVSLTIGFEPVFIIGNFSEVELTDSEFKLDTALVDVIDGETTVLELEGQGGNGLTVNAELPEGFELVENSGFENGKAKIAFRALGEKPESAKVTVSVKNGSKLLFTNKCDIVYTEPISYTYKISPYNDGRLWIEADFTNHRVTPVKMELEITSPDEIAKKNYCIERIEPENTRRLRINIPVSFASKNKIRLQGKIRTYSVAGNGEQDFETEITPGFMYYTEKTPVIDGVISPGEWETVHPMIFDARNGSMNMVVKDKADFYGRGYLMCDDDYMYFAAEMDDDVLYDGLPPASVWANDSVQFGFAQKATFGLGRTVFNFGISYYKPI